MCIERLFYTFLIVEVFETMPARSAAALKRKRERAREHVREWKKKNPAKVREQKKRYYARNHDKIQDKLRQWRKNNPELVRAQKRRHKERKVWSLLPRTRQRKDKDDEYDPDEILRGLFGVRVVLTDFRRALPPPPPLPSSQQQPGKRLSYSSSDSETDEGLSKELHLMLAEPEDPVKWRLEQLRKNRKKAEENRVRRMQKREKEAEKIIEITAERKVWPLLPRTRQRKDKDDEYDPDEILRGLFGVRVVLTDFRRALPPPPPLPSSQQQPGKRLSYSSSDSETDEGLSKELHLMLAEPEDPVKWRLEQLRKNRKKAEENRVRRMQKRQKEAEKIIEIAAELDEMSFMLHDMGKWFQQFEREDTVEQATQFEYSHNVEISAELMDQLEHYLF